MKTIIRSSLLVLLVLGAGFTQISCKKCINGSDILVEEVRFGPSVAGFESVVNSTNYELILDLDSLHEVAVAGDDNIIPYIRTSVVRNVLYITQDDDHCYKVRQPVKVYVRAKYIGTITNEEAGHVYSDNPWISTSLKINNYNSGSVNMKKLDLLDLDIVNEGSGSVSVQGITENASYINKGLGPITAGPMLSEIYTSASVTRSGNISLTYYNKLDIFISGSGLVYVSGSGEVDVNGPIEQVIFQKK